MNFCAFARENLSLIIIAAVALLTLFLVRDYLFIAIFSLSIAVVWMGLYRGMITTIITGAVVGFGVPILSICF